MKPEEELALLRLASPLDAGVKTSRRIVDVDAASGCYILTRCGGAGKIYI